MGAPHQRPEMSHGQSSQHKVQHETLDSNSSDQSTQRYQGRKYRIANAANDASDCSVNFHTAGLLHRNIHTTLASYSKGRPAVVTKRTKCLIYCEQAHTRSLREEGVYLQGFPFSSQEACFRTAGVSRVLAIGSRQRRRTGCTARRPQDCGSCSLERQPLSARSEPTHQPREALRPSPQVIPGHALSR